MSAGVRIMKASSQVCSKGFVSSFFLLIFLYLSSLSAFAVSNEICFMKTMMNMQTDAAYFAREASEISRIKCMLLSQEEEEAGSGEINIEIGGELPETITVFYDPQTRRIIDYSAVRYAAEVFDNS